MTSEDLKNWQKQMSYTYEQAADALGVNRSTYFLWLKNGTDKKMVALACAALRLGIID